MPTGVTQKIAPGIEWGAVSRDPMLNLPSIVIPIVSLSMMTDTEIAQAVRDAVSLVEYAQALEFAHAIDYVEESTSTSSLYALDEMHAEDRRLLHKFAGENPEIDRALTKLEAIQERLKAKAEAKANKANKTITYTMQVQREIQARYETIFIQLGRRDGFACQHCGVSTDLEIDHILPVSLGGTNDLQNLQLLCRSCNKRYAFQKGR